MLYHMRQVSLLLCGATLVLADTPFYHRVRVAHTVFGPLTLALFMPVGAIVIRTVRGGTWFHAGWMSFCYCLLIIDLGMGIWMALDSGQFDEFHCQIGIVVISCLIIQPITGLLHHSMFKKKQARTAFSYGHIWWGIALITLGIINAGLGLQLSHEKQKSTFIVYGVLAGVIWAAWMVTSTVSHWKGNKGSVTSPKREELPSPS
ncbi:hypothetical protein GQ53DRAFT_858104 [Thozetella sp. PMI_491]|nr:hypothetical protein GQ53DRAFT_858104 [Thozetella sp. PMI_491]